MSGLYICRRCGLIIDKTHKGNWRHVGANRRRPSCGKKPDPVDRTQFEREVDELLEAANRVMGEI